VRLTRTRYKKVTWDLEAKDLGKLAWGCALDDFTRCRAMQAFCRQRAKMEHEDEMFWEAEAEVWAQRAAQLDMKIDPGNDSASQGNCSTWVSSPSRAISACGHRIIN
jgi:hypothetical protein